MARERDATRMTKPQSKLPMVANGNREVNALRAQRVWSVKGSADVASTPLSAATTTDKEELWGH